MFEEKKLVKFAHLQKNSVEFAHLKKKNFLSFSSALKYFSNKTNPENSHDVPLYLEEGLISSEWEMAKIVLDRNIFAVKHLAVW